MHYMVIETFKSGRTGDIYGRLRDSGRHMPDGLTYVSSWISDDLTRCWQVMACDDRKLLADWMAHWDDLMDFEVIPVIGSSEARERALSDR